MSKGDFWYYIDVFDDKGFHQVFGKSHKTKSECVSEAKKRMENVKYDYAYICVMHYNKNLYNDYSENPIKIQPDKKKQQ